MAGGSIPSFPRVHFDFGAIGMLGHELAALGIARPLIITDKGLVAAGVLDRLRAAIPNDVTAAYFDDIPENPTIAGVGRALAVYKEEGCDGIVALGGGSVLDSGKALRVVATHDGALIDYLNEPERITEAVAPYITVPTTAGTGAEITFGGGIHPEPNTHGLGIRSMLCKPDVAICDPELTLSLPARLTAATGMDALSHCFEGYLGSRFNPPVAPIALDGIARVVKWIGRATANPDDREARWHMLMAALEGGMAIYRGLGPVHALGHAFGDGPLHHGSLVTVAMPPVIRFYEAHGVAELAPIAEALGVPSAAEIAPEIEAMIDRLGLPASVRAMGYDADLDRLIEVAHDAYFNLTAPVRPTRDDYRGLVEAVYG